MNNIEDYKIIDLGKGIEDLPPQDIFDHDSPKEKIIYPEKPKSYLIFDTTHSSNQLNIVKLNNYLNQSSPQKTNAKIKIVNLSSNILSLFQSFLKLPDKYKFLVIVNDRETKAMIDHYLSLEKKKNQDLSLEYLIPNEQNSYNKLESLN